MLRFKLFINLQPENYGRDVAQPGSALRSGRRGREFESRHPDQGHRKAMAFFCMGKTLYILQSQKNGRYYVGSTDNFQRRFTEHNCGQTKSTRNGIPWIAVFSFEFESSTEGLKAERRIKSLKSKKIIQGLINHTISISDLIEL